MKPCIDDLINIGELKYCNKCDEYYHFRKKRCPMCRKNNWVIFLKGVIIEK